MANKRRRDETEEERKERKRIKKEAKKLKRESQSSHKPLALDDSITPNAIDKPATTFMSSSAEESISTSEKICIRKTIRMMFSLYPSDLEDIVREIKRSLRHNLLKHIAGMDGVLLAFDNVKIVPNGGRTAGVILNEQPHIHYLADLDILVFSPSRGMRLSGIVTECFESHVGVLVYNFFNASISSDHLMAAGFSFDVDQSEWVHEDDGSTAIAADEALNFSVEKVHECAGTISMEGTAPTVVYALT